jgi:DNA-binding CsgD family transcriptional regulator
LIGRLIDLKSTLATSLSDTLDGLSAGMFLLDANGRIVHANAAGHALLEAGSVLRSEGGRLLAHDPAAELALHESFAASGDGDAGLGQKGIAILLTGRDEDRFAAHVLPLTSGSRRQVRPDHAASAALFVHKASLDLASPPELVARAYGLTPTELRIMLAIVEVGGVPEVSSALGVAESTVRTHLGRLFVKTGTNRQADLVKIIAAYSQGPVTSVT